MRRSWRGLEVYALVGKAGTGKSFRARLVAERLGVTAIVDDGLLIAGGRIVAGRSAKQDTHYLRAIKTALFHDPAHRAEVKAALQAARYSKVLLLGTSDRMIHRNCRTLELPLPRQILRIEEIATEAAIQAAIEDRQSRGRHVIPLPVIEVRRAYPRMIAEAIRVWFDQFTHRSSYEKTVVRPGYHVEGEVTITEAALSQMFLHCLQEYSPRLSLRKIKIHRHARGYQVRLAVALPYGEQAADTCERLQTHAKRQVEQYAGIVIERLSVTIEEIEAPAQGPSEGGQKSPPGRGGLGKIEND